MMLNYRHTFYSFSVDDLDKAMQFYSKIIGLKTEKNRMGLKLFLKEDGPVFVYGKKEHQPASFTIINFVVTNIDDAIEQLKVKGVKLEYYEGLTNEDRVHRGLSKKIGPDIAWFKDPAGNILSVLQEV